MIFLGIFCKDFVISNLKINIQKGKIQIVKEKKKKKFDTTAVTRIRTWVTAATTQGPNH